MIENKIYETFRDRAFWTDEIISDGLSSRLTVLEETITDLNLIQIYNKHKDHILTKKFSRREEGARSGADWLWFFGEPGSWLPLLIQAKIINPKTGTCHYLNHRQGKQKSLLLEYSRRHNFLPYYCIYSRIPEDFCPALKNIESLKSLNIKEWACSFLTPKQVRMKIARNENKAEKLINNGIPWSYPFLALMKNASKDRMANIISAELNNIRIEIKKISDPFKTSSEKKNSTRLDWEDRNPQEMIIDEIPNFILKFLSGKSNPKKSPVSSISIISSVPIKSIINEYSALPSHEDKFYINSLDSKYKDNESSLND